MSQKKADADPPAAFVRNPRPTSSEYDARVIACIGGSRFAIRGTRVELLSSLRAAILGVATSALMSLAGAKTGCVSVQSLRAADGVDSGLTPP